MKTIFFSEINLSTIFITILFKLLGFKVYFIAIDKKLRSKRLINTLEKFGIMWFSYQNYYFKNPSSKIQLKIKTLADEYSKKVTELVWSQNLKPYFAERQNLHICLHQNIRINLVSLCEISEIAKEIGDKDEKKYLWAPNHFFSEKAFKDNNIKNICPKYFTYLHFFFNCFIRSAKLIVFFLKKKIYSILKLYSKNNKQREENKLNPEIVFFPHCGVMTNNYKKTHYYSDDKTSPYYYSNILHIDWDRKDKRISKSTNEFYNEKKINITYWNEIKNNGNKYKYKEIISFIYLFLDLVKKLDLILVYNLFTILIKVEESKKKISNFKNLKVVLIGYDLVFPQEIAAACRSKNIKLVANQERPINPFLGFQYILDKYFVFGDESKFFFSKNMIDKKMEIINTGIVRMQYHSKEQKKLNIKNEEKFNLKCLVVDFTSNKDWYKNGRFHTINWNKNLLFYKDIVSLAKKNQNILFLIKSKRYTWLEIPYFYDILDEIKVSSNIQILNDYKKWTPSNCIKNVDFGIVLGRSLLGDELLVHNKPIISIEKELPFRAPDYGPNILSLNFEDLEHKITKIKLNINEYNKSLNLTRKKLFTEFESQNFSLALQKIYNEKKDNIK